MFYCNKTKKIRKYNKRVQKEFKLKKKYFKKKKITKKKQKPLKTFNLNFSKILLLLAFNMQRQLRQLFMFMFHVKFNQTLHRLISTKRLFSYKGKSNLYLFK